MTNSNYKVVPEAREALNKFKYEVASEVGVNLKDGYNGDLTADFNTRANLLPIYSNHRIGDTN